jgi:hypothetical protein
MSGCTVMENSTIVKEIVSWATERIKEEDADDLELGFSKNISAITKFYLAQYLLKLAVDWERQNRILMFNEEIIKSLIANQVGKDEEIKRVQDKLERMRKELIGGEKKGNGKTMKQSPAERNRHTPMKALAVRDSLDNSSGDGLFYRNRPLKELAPLILGSILKILPNPDNETSQLEKKFVKAEKEKADLARKYKDVSKKYRRTVEQYDREKRKFDEKSALYERQIAEIIRENNALMRIAADNGSREGEAIGDYVKREQYQVAKEFKEFCLRQGLEFLAEEIVALEQNTENEACHTKRHAERIIETKVGLSEILLIKPYKLQTKRMRTGRKLIDFEVFRKELVHILPITSIPKKMESEFMIIAQKAFGLIEELITMTPPCLLLLPEAGEVFDSEEHDVDEMVCKPEGLVKAIVVPGIQTGHRILTKPVVFTEPVGNTSRAIALPLSRAVVPAGRSEKASPAPVRAGGAQ